jgi:hypothetical protein
MNKIFSILFSLIMLFDSTALVYAKNDFIGVDRAKNVAGTAGYESLESEVIPNTVGTVINTLMAFVGMLFLVFMIYAGFLWMTARGEDDQIKKAVGIIKTSVVGLIILLSAYAISNFIIARINQ